MSGPVDVERTVRTNPPGVHVGRGPRWLHYHAQRSYMQISIGIYTMVFTPCVGVSALIGDDWRTRRAGRLSPSYRSPKFSSRASAAARSDALARV